MVTEMERAAEAAPPQMNYAPSGRIRDQRRALLTSQMMSRATHSRARRKAELFSCLSFRMGPSLLGFAGDGGARRVRSDSGELLLGHAGEFAEQFARFVHLPVEIAARPAPFSA
jgi:hypothetical protein